MDSYEIFFQYCGFADQPDAGNQDIVEIECWRVPHVYSFYDIHQK